MYYPFLGLSVFYYFQQYLQDILSAKLRLVAENVCWNFFDLLYCFESLSESRGNVRGANLGVMWLVGTLKGCSHLLIASDSEFGNFIQSDHNFSLLRFKLWLDPQEIDGYQNKKKKNWGPYSKEHISSSKIQDEKRFHKIIAKTMASQKNAETMASQKSWCLECFSCNPWFFLGISGVSVI